MTASIRRIHGDELIRLISPEIVGTITAESQEIMKDALWRSDMVWLGEDDGVPLGYWGIVLPSLLSDRAYLWLYALPALKEHRFVFVRQSQIVVKELLKDYPVVFGHCIRGEHKARRWLTWLGATFYEPEGRLVPFEIRAA